MIFCRELRNLTEHALSAMGYQVIVSENLDAGLRQVEHMPGRLTAIVMDPGSDAAAPQRLAAKVRAHAAELPILFTVAPALEPKDVLGDSKSVFLEKPFRVQELGKSLERLLGRPASNAPPAVEGRVG